MNSRVSGYDYEVLGFQKEFLQRKKARVFQFFLFLFFGSFNCFQFLLAVTFLGFFRNLCSGCAPCKEETLGTKEEELGYGGVFIEMNRLELGDVRGCLVMNVSGCGIK